MKFTTKEGLLLTGGLAIAGSIFGWLFYSVCQNDEEKKRGSIRNRNMNDNKVYIDKEDIVKILQSIKQGSAHDLKALEQEFKEERRELFNTNKKKYIRCLKKMKM